MSGFVDDAQEKILRRSLDELRALPKVEVVATGDVVVAYEMNGAPLPQDHGFPLRLVVPGYAAMRSVKWLSRLELLTEEAEGAWQRGLNYKTLPPSVNLIMASNGWR